MSQIEKKNCFIALGRFLSQFSNEQNQKDDAVWHNDLFFDSFVDLIHASQSHNGWFTPEQVYHAVQSWAKALTEDNLNQWLSRYDFSTVQPKTVGLILAGNIPLVGFHDFLSVLISGHNVLVKTSSNDQHLIQFMAKYLIAVCPDMKDCITFTDGKLENFEAVIATGSNNTARYFEYYFKDKPSIIRKNRNSVAILTGNESRADLVRLGEDIFRYFGLGCRNVSKLFIPRDYDFQPFFQAIYEYKDVIFYEKYANNYDYNKAVFLMSNFTLLDNEFLTLKEDPSYASPISSLFYEYYDRLEDVQQRLENDKDQIQCVVSNGLTPNSIPFGKTQQPALWDYADNVDTLQFLIEI
ncbi:acyl-CoA reductase [Flavobacterium sedimenticola]|uniref:Acyl-CoA reductase n=1 Tax=Flavobacterium sedimenticola TaxID=3043286 RepID=A0ABT6XTQ2_9FLAO|nr:acyl-CoA reductase [Flavobacterium sedimenticola]MDI9258474.1 acyl-CoA reductase [Flavobacterium sedimenticola]